ncbi:transcription-repair coupling factor [Desulfovibrio sp. OttesenSCG-928-G15]|nr:transcription-repair coupling factor [Desulfovibrio sp. OttesenSCG-928-G15]
MDFEALVDRLSGPSRSAFTVNRSGVAGVARLARSLITRGQNVVAVAANSAHLAECRAMLTLFNPERSSHDLAPTSALWDRTFVAMPMAPASSSGKSAWADRMAALFAMKQRSGAQGVLVSLDNFLLRLPPSDIFDTHEFVLHKNMEMAPELVLEQAVDWGYTRVPMVSVPGDIAQRGDILDVFCPGYVKPHRLDFFGDTLEEIRHFDPVSQRSVADVESMRLLPVSPVICSRELRGKAERYWKKLVKEGRIDSSDVAGLLRLTDAGGQGVFSGMFYEQSSCIEQWFPPDSVFILPGEQEVVTALEETQSRLSHFLSDEADVQGVKQPRSLVLRSQAEVLSLFSSSSRVYFEELRLGVEEKDEAISLPEQHFQSFQDVFPRAEALERPWQQLVSLMRLYGAIASGKTSHEAAAPSSEIAFSDLKEGGRLLLSFANDRARQRFLKLAAQDGVQPFLRYDPSAQGVFALVSPYRKGAYLPWDKTLVLGEDVLQPRVERGRKIPKGAFQGLDRYDSLTEGDFLVHRDYGVGVFKGLFRLNLGGTENDYLLLHYAGEDKLYLPVDRLSLIQRFKSAEGGQPSADRLGGSQWSASKDKARKAIEKIAADLVEMYALRKVVKGFRYEPINEMYREFEASFGFEETPDQAKAIEDVLGDMEKPEPMDRLVCGDVGFGKTEVALRAAFRAALEGRQVALLCPTTVLAEQHYQTFRSRLAGFPVNIGMMSRFVSKVKQKEVLEGAAKGLIDILVGTHRLLSKDVVLPNLGLLILDEEQRFGVRHKERLKEMRKNVDALTLTATPIPRTLQLSLSGIRELSVIETPPPERKPVATALIERNDATLKNIVERELAREGQVFWVYNRVQGLERVAEYVKKLAPQARVGMAHGQMSEKALEEAMHAFWHGDMDVLVCTSIIESGLDFPRANTLIVDQAQLFGLGQLYQLRGRVGRSDRQAFAVFVTPDPDRLPDIARQRMKIILDMDYLGAGFQVAMEDLRLRGAGNILGESQTGHMNRLGLDLFLEMLEEAVAKLKGQPLPGVQETELTLGVPAFIPEEYMADSRERLRYYKILSSAVDDAGQRDIEFEMRDRFGILPKELKNFLAVLVFKRYLSNLGVQKADIFPDKLRLAFAESSVVEPARLVDFVLKRQAQGHNVRLHPPAVLEMPLDMDLLENSLQAAKNTLVSLQEPAPASL